MNRIIQDSIIRKDLPCNPIYQYQITTNLNDDVILVQSNLFHYDLVRMYFPNIINVCDKLNSRVTKFTSVDQINRKGCTIYLTEL